MKQQAAASADFNGIYGMRRRSYDFPKCFPLVAPISSWNHSQSPYPLPFQLPTS